MTFILQDYLFISICILIAIAAIIFIYWLLNKSIFSNWFRASEDIVPSFMGVPAFLFGLTVSTFTANVMDNHVTAKTSLINETAAIRTLIRSSKSLDDHDKAKLSSATIDYVKSIIDTEWPAMVAGNTNELSNSPELDALTTIADSISSKTNGIRFNESRIEAAIQTIHRERIERLTLAYDVGNFAKWPSVYVLSFMMLFTIGILQLRRSKAMKISLVMGALCIGSSMIFIFLNISPYRGPIAVKPNLLQKSISY